MTSVTARKIFAAAPEVKKKLWDGEFWGKGYLINTVGQHGSESVIAAYVQAHGDQGEYRQLHKAQMELGLYLTIASGLAPRIFTPIRMTFGKTNGLYGIGGCGLKEPNSSFYVGRDAQWRRRPEPYDYIRPIPFPPKKNWNV